MIIIGSSALTKGKSGEHHGPIRPGNHASPQALPYNVIIAPELCCGGRPFLGSPLCFAFRILPRLQQYDWYLL